MSRKSTYLQGENSGVGAFRVLDKKPEICYIIPGNESWTQTNRKQPETTYKPQRP